MTLYEQERAAYIAGDTERAELLARIDELQRALERAVAELELMGVEHDAD
jgi:anti-sigma factor RsiW